MRVRQLESALSANVDETFATPKQRLEQYPTNAALAAGVLHGARARGDVEGKFVVDLGCGTGILSVAATLFVSGVISTSTGDASSIFPSAAPKTGSSTTCETWAQPAINIPSTTRAGSTLMTFTPHSHSRQWPAPGAGAQPET